MALAAGSPTTLTSGGANVVWVVVPSTEKSLAIALSGSFGQSRLQFLGSIDGGSTYQPKTVLRYPDGQSLAGLDLAADNAGVAISQGYKFGVDLVNPFALTHFAIVPQSVGPLISGVAGVITPTITNNNWSMPLPFLATSPVPPNSPQIGPGLATSFPFIAQQPVLVPPPYDDPTNVRGVLLNVPSAVQAASGNFPFNVLPYQNVLLLVNLTALTTSATFFFETLGADGVWYALYSPTALTAAGTVIQAIGLGLTTSVAFNSVCRLRWTSVGGVPTFSASVTGF